jgi:excisionase family DNA binding protein
MIASSGLEAMTIAEVAKALGVTPRQVQRLVNSGTLTAAGRVGRSFLVDANSVNQLRVNGPAQGRPWNERTVWAAMALLSGQPSDELTSSQQWHLHKRLKQLTAEDLVRATRRRACICRYRVSESFLAALREEVVLTAGSALAVDQELSAEFGLGAAAHLGVDGYLPRNTRNALVTRYVMADDLKGNAVLRITAESIPAGERGHAIKAIVALDLAESLDPRERSAGQHVLNRLIAHL